MKNKIEKLTPKQESKFQFYVDKWVKIGLSTKPVTLEDAQIDFHAFQKVILQKENPAPVILVDSPRQANKEIKKRNKIKGKMKCVYPYFDCQYWANWAAFYEFFKKECGIKYDCKEAYDVMIRCINYGMVYPLDDVCIVVQHPTVIKKNASGLHCENGPALSYNGDNEIYALNGVVMDKEYVMTPAHKIKAKDILKETNVEVRRELLRKVGIERMLADLPNRMLEKRGNYELYSIDLSNEIKNAKYLKMTNPSVGCFHMEGVAPEIETIDAALKWRNQNMFVDADVLT